MPDFDPMELTLLWTMVYWLLCSICTLFMMDAEAFDKDKALGTLLFAFGLGWLFVPCRLLCKLKVL